MCGCVHSEDNKYEIYAVCLAVKRLYMDVALVGALCILILISKDHISEAEIRAVATESFNLYR
jgi:hypothetical protein